MTPPHHPINPSLLQPSHMRVNDKARGTHSYRAVLVHHGRTLVSRRVLSSATSAREYAGRILARWKEIYEASMPEPEPEAAPRDLLLDVLDDDPLFRAPYDGQREIEEEP